MIRPEIKVIKMETVSALASSEIPSQAKGITIQTLTLDNADDPILF